MKKGTLILITLLLMVIGYSAYNTTINIYGNSKIAENISDFKVYISSLKVNGNEVSGINGSKDGFSLSNIDGNIEVEITNDSTEYDTEASLECTSTKNETSKVWNYDYTGREQVFSAPATGVYKLETWGAQGGGYTAIGGYGGYSIGNTALEKGSSLYINVGERGKSSSTNKLEITYNGGGESIPQVSYENIRYFSSGGGATHIATYPGLLSTLEKSKSNILIASGGGGGAYYSTSNKEIANGGSSGGYIGSNGSQITLGWGSFGYGGTQTAGGYSLCNNTTCSSNNWERKNYSVGGFGYGGYSSVIKVPSSGGGSGFYGGGGSGHVQSAGGGSSYIGNQLLTEKSMYCYNCIESNETSTKTISTTCTSSTPTENCAKQGDGYAKITLIESTEHFETEKNVLSALDINETKIENMESTSLTCKLKLNKISRTKKKIYTGSRIWNYDYTGGEQAFIAPVSGTYKLETWGASGGDNDSTVTTRFAFTAEYVGGYGGYSVGNIKLTNGQKLYLNIGGKGENSSFKNRESVGGYNGGGNGGIGAYNYWVYSRNEPNPLTSAGGGGATHISFSSGLLSTLKNNISNILIVSGGGGGTTPANYNLKVAGSGGGISGNLGYVYNGLYVTGGNQTNGYLFGKGQNGHTSIQGTNADAEGSGGGGGGFFGGYSYQGNETESDAAGAGGSGYIGNTLLTNKAMYCYNCSESNEVSTKTMSTTCTSSTPTENCAKQGNGYARITLISID